MEVSILVRRKADNKLPSEHDLLSGRYEQRSRDEVAEDLAAAPEDMAAVEDFARRSGLTVVEENPAARRVRVRGTPQQMEAAFGVQLESVADSRGQPRSVFKGSVPIPPELTGIVTAVLGLDPTPIAKPRS